MSRFRDFEQAVFDNDILSLERLLAAGESVNITNRFWTPPLHLAVRAGRREVFDFLLTVDDVKIDCINHRGDTPLMWAALFGDAYYAQKLIKKGADVNVANRLGETALHLAINKNRQEFFDFLLTVDDLTIDIVDRHGCTPLMWAARLGYAYYAQELIKKGVDVNVGNNDGETALYLAIYHDKQEFFDFLLTVDDLTIDIVDHDGCTPLMWTARLGCAYYAQELIKKGADVNAANKKGLTALHYMPSLSVAEALVFNGADLDARDNGGETPLFKAVGNRKYDLVYLLLYYGATATVPNNGGLLPFSLCSSRDCDPGLQQILFDHTFDDVKEEVAFNNLRIAMLYAPEFFNKMLDKIIDVYYDAEDLVLFVEYRLASSDTQSIQSLLKFPRFTDAFLQLDLFGAYHSYTNHERSKFDFLSFFYFLGEEDMMSNVVETRNILKRPLVGPHITSLPEDASTKFLFFLLSHGMQLTSTDLDRVYNRYGFCDFFKMLLHIEYVDNPNLNFNNILPRIIYDLHTWKKLKHPSGDLIENLKPTDVDTLKTTKITVIAKLRTLFSLPPSIIAMFNEEETETVPQVPSLLELSRDSFRDHFIRRYNIKNSVEFFTYLRWLPIPEGYKEIVSFERPIYV